MYCSAVTPSTEILILSSPASIISMFLLGFNKEAFVVVSTLNTAPLSFAYFTISANL